jgi:ABC-type sugar transport system permease subunit
MTQEAFFNPVTNRDEFYCKTWATSFIKTQLLSMLSVVMVVLVNVLLARILNVLVAMEKHHTESSQVVSRITKVFIAQFCNAALLMVVINANLSYFVDDQSIALSSFAILNGKYSDFTPAWYNDVGIALMLTMIINTFSPHMYVVVHYIAMEAKRFYDRGFSFDYSITRQDTQRDLDALYRGPKFDLAARYAQTLTSIFITYLV